MSKFSLYQTNITSNTYEDLDVTPNIYEYYTVPVFPGGQRGERSNIVQATVTGLIYLYASSTNKLEIIDVRDPDNIFVAAYPNISIPSAGSHRLLSDSKYLYLKLNSSAVSGLNNDTLIIDWETSELTPSIVKTLPVTGLVGAEPTSGDIIVRRNKLTYNNLLFGVDNTGKLTIHNIADPVNPVLLSSTDPLNGQFLPQSFSFDATTGRLYYTCIRVGGSGTNCGYFSVASNGTITGRTDAVVHNSADQLHLSGVIFQNQVWWQYPNGSNLVGRNLTTLAIDNGLLWGGQVFGTRKPLVYKNYLYVSRYIAHASYNAITIYDNSQPYPQPIATLGALNTQTTCVLISHDVLYYLIDGDSTLRLYDISNPTTPVALDSVLLSSGPLAISGYPSEGWDSQNGLCSI